MKRKFSKDRRSQSRLGINAQMSLTRNRSRSKARGSSSRIPQAWRNTVPTVSSVSCIEYIDHSAVLHVHRPEASVSTADRSKGLRAMFIQYVTGVDTCSIGRTRGICTQGSTTEADNER